MSLSVNVNTTSSNNEAHFSTYGRSYRTKKMDLAEKISKNSLIPQEILEKVVYNNFKVIIHDFEINRTPFKTEIKDRIWQKISNKIFLIIKELFILEVIDTIFPNITEDESADMLENPALKGKIKHIQKRTAVYRKFLECEGLIREGIKISLNDREKDLEEAVIKELQREDIRPMPETDGLGTIGVTLANKLSFSPILYPKPIDPQSVYSPEDEPS